MSCFVKHLYHGKACYRCKTSPAAVPLWFHGCSEVGRIHYNRRTFDAWIDRYGPNNDPCRGITLLCRSCDARPDAWRYYADFVERNWHSADLTEVVYAARHRSAA